MPITELLNKHFPKEELTAGELYTKFNDYDDHHWCVANGQRFTHMHWKGRKSAHSVIELYLPDNDYPEARVGEYTMVAVYDVSDTDKVRAFLHEYIETLDADALRWELRDVVDYGE